MKQLKYVKNLFLFILLFVAVSYFYFGITRRVAFSQDYNVPIAQSFLNGTFLNIHSNNPYMYFPGSSHIFLVSFLLTGLPNLFGLFGWIVLFIICKKLADTFDVSKHMAIIFAATFSTTISVVRTIGDQSIDKWLCIWFLFALILFEKVQKTWKHSLLIGLSLGMLVGTKYSGPLFFIAVLLIYGKRLITAFTPLQFIFSLLIFTVTGLFWYIRNFILIGSPYYPANLPFFPQHNHFAQQDWMLWRVLLFYPKGIPDLISAFLSEYMIWAFSGFFVIGFLVYKFKKKKPVDGRITRLSLLGLTTGTAVLFLPITTPYKIPLFHTISDMRYIYIFIAVIVLAAFLIADRYKKNELLGTIALLNALPVFSFIPYQPKIFILCIFLFFISFKKIHILEKL